MKNQKIINILKSAFVDESKDTTLILIQGLPGSGKSTLAKDIMSSFDIKINHFEADSFFIDNDTKEYKFNPKCLSFAHDLCFANTAKSLFHHIPCIVSNTFLSDKELKPYIDFHLDFNYVKVILIKMTTQYNSVHNIPDNTMRRMKQKFETQMTYSPDLVI